MITGCSDSAASRWRQPLDAAEWGRREATFRAGLIAALRQPPARVAPATLAALFDSDVLELVADMPSGIEDHPDLPIRIRGALGRALAELPPPVTWRLDPFARSRAFDILYQSLGMLDRRTAIPKPIVVHAEIVGTELRIRVNLIGAGGYWWPDVAVAMQAALEGGINLNNESRFRVAARVRSLFHRREAGVDRIAPLPTVSMARIQLLSPLRLRSGTATRFDPASLLIAMANRVSAIARWQYLGMDVDWNQLHKAAWAVELTHDELVPVQWARGSIRQAARIPMLGYVGSITLGGDLVAFAPLLAIAERVNIGSHAALGFGRIRATLYP